MSLGCFFAHVLVLILTLSLIRTIISSIVWCDQGGKYNKFKRKTKPKKAYQIVFCSYLEEYTDKHRQNFRFWYKFYIISGFSELALVLIHLVVLIVIPSSLIRDYISLGFVMQAVLLGLFIAFQFRGKETKYDLERMQKK